MSEARVLSLLSGDWIIDDSRLLAPPGSFGTVYRGKNSDGQQVAIKILRSAETRTSQRELDIGKLLLHHKFHHVVPILDVGFDRERQQYALVMPLAQTNLDEAIRSKGPLAESAAAEALLHIVDGVSEISSYLVHRDLKPANVLYHEGRWKISDFSTSRIIDAMTADLTTRPWLSPHYAAPEQWRLETATSATDVYAIGCIAHFIVTGQAPFNEFEDNLRQAHCEIAPPVPAHLSSTYRLVIDGCMRKSTTDRPTIPQLRRWIEMVGDTVDTTTIGSAALARSVANLVREKSEQEAHRLKMSAERDAHLSFVRAAKSRLSGIQESLYEELVQRVPGARIQEFVETTEVSRSQGAFTFSTPGPNVSHRVVLLTESVYVELSDKPQQRFDYALNREALTSARIIASRISSGAVGRAAFTEVSRLLLYRPDAAGDYRWHEHRAYPCTILAKPQLQPPSWEGRLVADHGRPIDDEAIFEFIDRWLHIAAQAIDGTFTEDDHTSSGFGWEWAPRDRRHGQAR